MIIGLAHSDIKYDPTLSPMINLIKGPSTYIPSVEDIGPIILLLSREFPYTLIHISKVYSLNCPFLFSIPSAGKIKDGLLLFGLNTVTLLDPKTNGTPVFLASKDWSSIK